MGYICSNPWTTAFIWGNGDVTHCCYSNIGSLGNINEKSLADIWKGSKLAFVRGKISGGDYIGAGCEQFCRVFRWNSLYGGNDDMDEIPEGLGRLNDFDPNRPPESPLILGLEMEGKCNFRCRHCLVSQVGEGLSRDLIQSLEPYLQKARIVRLVGGEFTVNPESLSQLKKISQLTSQPAVFMNTNGFVSLDQYYECVKDLKSFHLKFSLEGMGEHYEKIRTGGKWERFIQNLNRANEIFTFQRSQGNDWRLYLNYCVMYSNFSMIPDIAGFAVERNIPLVLNTLNGMRHIDENIFMYAHLTISSVEIERVISATNKIADTPGYVFSKELKLHLDYIVRRLANRKLKLSKSLLKAITQKFKGRKADRLLYLFYKLSLEPRSALIYSFRKLRKVALRKRLKKAAIGERS